MQNKKNAVEQPQVVLLMGATATGKTKLAFDLFDSHSLPIQIINVDSVQLYRGFNIGSAKPDSEHIKKYKLRMIDICDPDEVYTVTRFCHDIEREIFRAQQLGKIPLLTGGTMLYFRALRQGISVMPKADQQLRNELRQQLQQYGTAWLHKQLVQVDPNIAQRISINDSQRIVRALEVYRLSGKPLSQWHKQTKKKQYQYLSLMLSTMDREQLHHSIECRFNNMIEQGLVEEVSLLKEKWHQHLDKPVFRSIGYRQVIDYLRGEYSYQTMIERGIIATRQLAKHQTTWLRSWPEIHQLKYDKNQALVDQLATMVNKFVSCKIAQ